MPIAQQQLDDALARAGLDPQEMAGEPLTDPRFTHGQVLAVSGAPRSYELASNDNASRAATNIWYIGNSRGLGKGAGIIRSGPFRWPGHGLGPDGGKLWLGKDGAMVCAANAPEGDGVVLEQALGAVVDKDTIHWDPQMAVVKETE